MSLAPVSRTATQEPTRRPPQGTRPQGPTRPRRPKGNPRAADPQLKPRGTILRGAPPRGGLGPEGLKAILGLPTPHNNREAEPTRRPPRKGDSAPKA